MITNDLYAGERDFLNERNETPDSGGFSPEFLLSIFENSHDLISVIDENGNYRFVMKMVKEILGYEPHELIGTSAFSLIHEDDVAKTAEQLASIGDHKKVTTEPFRCRHKDGTYRWVITTITDMREISEVGGVVTNSKDVTDQVVALQKKNVTQAYYRSLFFNNPDLVYSLTLQGRFNRLNDRVLEVTGFSKEQLIGLHFSDIVHPDSLEDAEAVFRQGVSGIASSSNIRIQHPTDDFCYVFVSVMPVVIEGKVHAVTGTAKNVTSKFIADLRLQQLADDLIRQNTDLQQFSFMVSHDLRAPVASILGTISLLQSLRPSDEEWSTYLSMLSSSAANLDTIVHDMSSIISVRASGKKLPTETISVHAILGEVLLALEHEIEHVEPIFNVQIDGNAEEIESNRAYMHSIFSNIIANSLKYAAGTEGLEITIRVSKQEGRTVIEIADNGPGINTGGEISEIFQVFKRFNQDKEGRGLGLYMVKTQIEALGGKIEVLSKAGEGVRFIISLP